MRRFPAAAAMAAGWFFVAGAARADEGPAGTPAYAIPEAMGPRIVDMAKVDGEPDAEGLTLQGVSTQVVSAILTYRDGSGREVRLELAHPETAGEAVARTRSFAILAPGGSPVPPGLVAALKRRIEAREDGFEWARPVRAAAVPADPLNRPRYALTDRRAQETWRRGVGCLQTGDLKGAVREARALLARHGEDPEAARAAASLLRRAGRAADAVRALAPVSSGAGGDASRLGARTEWVASLELAGDPRAATAASDLARDFPRLFPAAACARYEALGVLLQEGLAREADRLGGPDDPGSDAPACAHWFRVKAAMALGDDREVDRRAGQALRAFPDDPDIRFLWGTHYYRKGADPEALGRAIAAWDPLVRRDPRYPTLLGQYGTAVLVAGRLDREAADRMVAEARKDPDDVVTNYLAGLGLYYQKRYSEVIPFLEKAARAVPDEPRARMYLAMAHFFSGDRETAGRMLEALEPYAYQEPDINYCRSLFYRSHDLPRAIREMERFLEVFEGEHRLRFGEQKVRKAKDDLERMRRGEVPPVELPTPDVPSPRGPAPRP